MTCSSSWTWAYMLVSIPCSLGNSKGGAGWRSRHSWFCEVLQMRHAIGSLSVRWLELVRLQRKKRIYYQIAVATAGSATKKSQVPRLQFNWVCHENSSSSPTAKWKSRVPTGVPSDALVCVCLLCLLFRKLQWLQQNWPPYNMDFFCCALRACHEGRGRSPSVSGIGEKTDFLTFQLNCKNIQQINTMQTNWLTPRSSWVIFLLAAAWVDPGRSALQSAEQRCQRRYGRIHQVGWMSSYDKNMQKGRNWKQHAKRKRKKETIHRRARVKSCR